jgi:acyl-CoA oxidase
MPSPLTKRGEEDELNTIMADFAHGPLDVYRQAATIDWRQMKLFFEGEEFLRKKVRANVCPASIKY